MGEKKREEEEKKRREETTKLRDKLAAKARDKMVQAAKEKALQLERKRKAASFLALLAEKKTTVSSAAAVSPQTTLRMVKWLKSKQRPFLTNLCLLECCLALPGP